MVVRKRKKAANKKKNGKKDVKKLTVQQTIAYKEMGRDGICRVQGNVYSKCIRFYDINYQLAQNEDKNAIFENWCDFLNYFDSSIHFQLSFINHKSSMKEFEQVIKISPQGDAYDDIRMEYANMLKKQLAKGNNGLVKTKYIIFSIAAENIWEAKPKLERIESDILNNFKILGVMAYPLNGEERLRILYETFNPDSTVDFQFDYGSMIKTGLNTKDYVAPTSFVFKDGKTFQMGNTVGAISYLQILAPELTDKMLAEFLDIDKDLIVNLHIQSVDQMKAIKLVKSKVVMNGVEYTVEDTGAFARYGVQFDVYYDNHSAASAHGHQTWEAFIADSNGSNEVTVTNTTTKKILYVTLGNTGFDAVARANLNEEQMVLYNALNTTYGNRNYLWDVENISTGSGSDGMSYEIPPEALQDEEFARMIREAEKYLGVPYVWGGYSPSGFDCSGFVSYVINHCGNGWNLGRQTAEGLRNSCTFVSPGDAKPGDLIFFQGTYNTPGASHVGIYVGNNMMIHCGDPIHYSNISTSYWQQHFMCFGRLP